MIRLLLVDDHASIRQALAWLLDQEPDMRVVAQAGSLAEARRMLRGVDVAIVDLRLPDGDGVDLVRDVRAANKSACVLVLTAERDRRRVAAAVLAGASAVLHKSEPLDALIAAVRRLTAGERWFSPTETVELMRLAEEAWRGERDARDGIAGLTAREREVLVALARGASNAEIAQQLGIGVETVRTHVANVFSKIGVDSRLQALAFALRYGLIDLDDLLPPT